MPIYQYLCPSCNYAFELKQGFNDECKASCPHCHNGARRLFIPVPIIFKGSGFYVTDHSSKSEAQLSPKENKNSKEDTKAKENLETKEIPKATKEVSKDEKKE